MTNARYDVTEIEAACGSHVFRATHQSMKFSGFTAIYEEGRDDEQEKLDSPLPDLAPGEAPEGRIIDAPTDIELLDPDEVAENSENPEEEENGTPEGEDDFPFGF